MQPTEKTYMTFKELAKNISLANDFATQYFYFVPTLKEIYDDQNLKSGTGELGAETISSIYKTIDIFKNDKKYISRIKMLCQLLDAQSDKSPSAKKFQEDFNFINSAFIDIDTANKLLDKIDTIQDESIKITVLRTMTQTWRSRHPLAIKLRKRAATLATQSPNAELVDFRCLHNILDRGDPEREVALLSLDRKITELIGTELEKDTPNKKRIDTYIRIILEATETTYNNIFYPTAVQEEKIKAVTEKFKLKSIQENANNKKILQKFTDLATRIKGDWYRAGPEKAIQKLAQKLLSR